MVHILQLTYGWTMISVYVNIVNLILVIPAMFWIVPKYGALGAAYIWLALNLGGIIISVHFTFRKRLSSEKWKWYWQDVFLPLFISGLVIGIFKFLLPVPHTNLARILVISFALIFALFFSSLVASQVRLFLKLNIRKYLLARKGLA